MAIPYRAALTRGESTRGVQVSHNTTTPAADRAIGAFAQIRGGINLSNYRKGKPYHPDLSATTKQAGLSSGVGPKSSH
jgi:hypothetical protein